MISEDQFWSYYVMNEGDLNEISFIEASPTLQIS